MGVTVSASADESTSRRLFGSGEASGPGRPSYRRFCRRREASMHCACLLLFTMLEQTPKSELRTAASHPMKYHLSLPQGWSKQQTFPMVIVIPDAARDFTGNLQVF